MTERERCCVFAEPWVLKLCIKCNIVNVDQAWTALLPNLHCFDERKLLEMQQETHFRMSWFFRAQTMKFKWNVNSKEIGSAKHFCSSFRKISVWQTLPQRVLNQIFRMAFQSCDYIYPEQKKGTGWLEMPYILCNWLNKLSALHKCPGNRTTSKCYLSSVRVVFFLLDRLHFFSLLRYLVWGAIVRVWFFLRAIE